MKVPFLIWICCCHIAQISIPVAAATVLRKGLQRANSSPAKLPGANDASQKSQKPKLERQNTAPARLMVPMNPKGKPRKLADAAEKRTAALSKKVEEQSQTTMRSRGSTPAQAEMGSYEFQVKQARLASLEQRVTQTLENLARLREGSSADRDG